jgi:hypothetical protein
MPAVAAILIPAMPARRPQARNRHRRVGTGFYGTHASVRHIQLLSIRFDVSYEFLEVVRRKVLPCHDKFRHFNSHTNRLKVDIMRCMVLVAHPNKRGDYLVKVRCDDNLIQNYWFSLFNDRLYVSLTDREP